MEEHHEARHHEVGPGHQLERLVFFSDAVFAIAITLLVIEIHPPHLHFGASLGEHAKALLPVAPALWAFVISFWVIGAFWAGHHRAFSVAGHWDERLFRTNLGFLLAIVAMPFFTALMGINAFARLPVVLYCGWMLLAALLNLNLQRRVFAAPVLAAHADRARIGTYRRRGLAVTMGAASALVASAVLPVPAFGMALLATMPFWRLLLERRAARLNPA